MAMTGIDVLSLLLGLIALSAFLVAAILMTIFLLRETEYHPPRGLEPPVG